MYTLYQNDINLGNMLRMAILGQTLIWQGLTHFFVTLWDCIKIYIGSEPAMGAAAFQNKVIDELAVLYLEHAQEAEAAKGSGKRIDPPNYRTELARVKAYIATRNVYGVDINRDALELGKIALWLNTIYKGMEPPFFVNRLCLGNAVLGTGLTCYNFDRDLSFDVSRGYTGWSSCKKPERVVFLAGKPDKNGRRKQGFRRDRNSFYTFLIPVEDMDKGFALDKKKDITGLRAANKKGLEILKERIADWTKPLSSDDVATLKRLSDAFDVKLELFYSFQKELTGISATVNSVWPNVNNDTDIFGGGTTDYKTKKDLLAILDQDGSPAAQLRTVMNYWCALWFWPIEKLDLLPTRDEFWKDLGEILNVSRMETVQDPEKSAGSLSPEDVALEKILVVSGQEDAVSFTKYKTHMTRKELTDHCNREVSSRNTEVWESERIRIVRDIAAAEKFCHQELEFLEVFWERGGFDIIAGNPPWVVPRFDIGDILSESNPEVEVKGYPAPKATEIAKEIVNTPENRRFREFYGRELLKISQETSFTNAQNPDVTGNDLYRIILAKSLNFLNPRGFMGMIHPVSVFTDAKGGDFRKILYPRLKYHFRYANERLLFPEVHHSTVFSVNIYRGENSSVSFDSVTGLYLPGELDLVLRCGTPDHKRLVHYSEEELKVVREVFDPESDDAATVTLVALPNSQVLGVLSKFSHAERRVGDCNPVVTSFFNNTAGVKDGYIKPENRQPEVLLELIMVGPQLTVGNPLFQCPRASRQKNSEQDTIDLTKIGDDYLPRTTLVPALKIAEFRNLNHFADTEMRLKDYPKNLGINELKELQKEELLRHYKISYRRQLGRESARTVHACISPLEVSHVNTVQSVFFKNEKDLLLFSTEMMSLPYDFFIKVKNIGDLFASSINPSPMLSFKSPKQEHMAFSRVLTLNCLTGYYRDLWERNYSEEFKNDSWSIQDPRLKPFSTLERVWSRNIPLRNDFERRQALVEIDVLVAMAMGFTLEDLQFMYQTKFRVLQNNEADTWYDSTGRIVFTVAQSDVGVERPVFQEFQKRAAAGETEFRHIIRNNQLYAGEEIVYRAPFNRCDRLQDYRTAWEHFSKILV